MKRSTLLAAVLLLGLATGASADSVETTVTPANIKEQSPGLEVKVREADGLEQFEVIVKGSAGERARFLQGATLTLMKGGKTIARCPVARTERKEDVVFSFAVAADHLAGATFRLTSLAHVKRNDKWVGMPSADFLTFPLADFAKQK